MKPGARIGTVVAVLCWVPLTVQALDSDRDQPIRIKSRHVSMDEKSGQTVYTGNVEVVQGTLRLTADRAVVVRRNGQTEHVHGTGRPLTMKQEPKPDSPDIHAEARRMEYNVLTGEIELYDDVVVTQGQDEMKSDYVYYRTEDALMRARATDPGRRVQAVLHPKPKEAELP